MVGNKRISEAKTNDRQTQNVALRDAQLQHLRDEIDKLAMLVSEAKRQSDKIQAAADALGDTQFGNNEERATPITPLLRATERLR